MILNLKTADALKMPINRAESRRPLHAVLGAFKLVKALCALTITLEFLLLTMPRYFQRLHKLYQHRQNLLPLTKVLFQNHLNYGQNTISRKGQYLVTKLRYLCLILAWLYSNRQAQFVLQIQSV